jgi:hypothetical protein
MFADGSQGRRSARSPFWPHPRGRANLGRCRKQGRAKALTNDAGARNVLQDSVSNAVQERDGFDMALHGAACAMGKAVCVGLLMLGGCSVQLVAPYNPDLAQRASSLQAEIAAWDLTMLKTAGTQAADPRNSAVIATLNKWRGEREAMLTLAISNDPHTIPCAKATGDIYALVSQHIPADLKSVNPPATTSSDDLASTSGCETVLVADIQAGIDALQSTLQYCQLPWLTDASFTNPPPAARTQAAPADQQMTVQKSCAAEFRPAPGVPQNAAEFGHGRAASGILTTLQAITYIESRKRALSTAKVGL